jgi:hypothetical protein
MGKTASAVSPACNHYSKNSLEARRDKGAGPPCYDFLFSRGTLICNVVQKDDRRCGPLTPRYGTIRLEVTRPMALNHPNKLV